MQWENTNFSSRHAVCIRTAGIQMKKLDVNEIVKALPELTDEELAAMQVAAKTLMQAVTKEARRRRGTLGTGVLAVRGRTYKF
jgi:hypothetical protein